MTYKLIIAALITLSCSMLYILGKNAGHAEANVECTKKMQEYQEALNRQTDTLNAALRIEAVDLSKEVGQLLKDTQAIKQQLKQQPQPLVLIKEGECKAADQLLEARRKMIERVNQ